MFDLIGKKLYPAVVAFIVILLAVVFALQFGGPQAQGCSAGGAATAATVYSTTLTDGDFRAAYSLAGFDRYDQAVAQQRGLRKMVLDGLVERVLLARAARQAGFHSDEDEVMRQLAEKGTVHFSIGVDSGQESGEIPVPVKNADGHFDRALAKRFIQYGLRRSVSEFAEAQTEETLAYRMRESVLASVEVSPREVWETFVRERDTVKLKYVRFSPAYYRDRIDPSEDDIRAWMADHQEAVDREYQANRHRYTGLEKQVRSRHILIKVDHDASDEVRAAARARAEALLGRARAGEDFAQLARENSEDTGSARRGGDLGFNPRGRMVRPFDDAQFSMQPGEISDLVESRFGFHIIKVEAIREGDVPEDEAKLELSDRLYREDRAGSMAEQAAIAALAALHGGTTMDALDAQLRGLPAPDDAQDGAEGVAADDSADTPDDPLAPKVQESGEFGRADTPISGPFDNGPLVRAALALSVEDPLPEEPIQLGDDYFVFRVEERNTPSRDEFTDAVRTRISQGLLRAKQREAMQIYVHRLRREAEAAGAIHVNEAVLRYGGGDENEEGAGGRSRRPGRSEGAGPQKGRDRDRGDDSP